MRASLAPLVENLEEQQQMSGDFVGKKKYIYIYFERKGRRGKIADRMFPITAETENRRGCSRGVGAAGKMGKIWRRCRLKVGRDAAG